MLVGHPQDEAKRPFSLFERFLAIDPSAAHADGQSRQPIARGCNGGDVVGVGPTVGRPIEDKPRPSMRPLGEEQHGAPLDLVHQAHGALGLRRGRRTCPYWSPGPCRQADAETTGVPARAGHRVVALSVVQKVSIHERSMPPNTMLLGLYIHMLVPSGLLATQLASKLVHFA